MSSCSILYLACAFSFYVCVHAGNVAFNKPTSQSGGIGPHLAVNSVVATPIQTPIDGNCAQVVNPTSSGAAWWTIDLADGNPSLTFDVTHVKIFSCLSSDGCTEARVLEIYAGNYQDLATQTPYGSGTVNGGYDPIVTISIAPPSPVRFITVKAHTESDMTLCEVEVEGTRAK